MNNEQLGLKERFDYAMKHFSLIADQRIKTFNFYIITVAAATSGSLALANNPKASELSIFFVGNAHMMIAVIFMMIDFRGCRLLAISSAALQTLEQGHLNGINERQICEDATLNKRGIWYAVSYRIAFLIAFVLHAVFGYLFANKSEWFMN